MKKKILCSLFLLITIVVATGSKLASEPRFFSKLCDLSKPAGVGVVWGKPGDDYYECVDVTRSRLRWDMTVDVTVEVTVPDAEKLIRLVLYGGTDENGNGKVDQREWKALAEGEIEPWLGGVKGTIDSVSVGLFGAYCVSRYRKHGLPGANAFGKGVDLDFPHRECGK